MTQRNRPIDVYLEVGQTRTFAIVPAWPGWCRSGRDEAAALQALRNYAPRYAKILTGTPLHFPTLANADKLGIVERVKGDTTTDFGAPSVVLALDNQSVELTELERWQAILTASWHAFDAAVQAAIGKTLRKGPRGGGREVEAIVQHVREAELDYLSQLGGKLTPSDKVATENSPAPLRRAILVTVSASAQGEIPARGPRGGLRWPPRYFVRRLVWHTLDHVWEIEDRIS